MHYCCSCSWATTAATTATIATCQIGVTTGLESAGIRRLSATILPTAHAQHSRWLSNGYGSVKSRETRYPPPPCAAPLQLRICSPLAGIANGGPLSTTFDPNSCGKHKSAEKKNDKPKKKSPQQKHRAEQAIETRIWFLLAPARTTIPTTTTMTRRQRANILMLVLCAD